jgi:hypothetical protein
MITEEFQKIYLSMQRGQKFSVQCIWQMRNSQIAFRSQNSSNLKLGKSEQRSARENLLCAFADNQAGGFQ